MTVEKQTFCRICEPYCPMLAEIDGSGKVTKLKPNPDHPCQGTPCNKGLSFLEVHNDPDRLNYPLKRKNPRTEDKGDFERISWKQSFAEIGEKFRDIRDRHGADSIAVVVGNPIGFNARLFMLLAKFIGDLGSKMVFNALTQDLSNKSYGAGLIYGSPSMWMAPDLYNTDYLLCIGSNPKVSHWTLISVPNDNGDTLKRIKQRGDKVRFVNPRKIESSTEETGDTLLIRPGTDAYFLAAVLHEIFRKNKIHAACVAEYGKNIDGLRSFVADFSPEKVSPVVGVAAETIRQVADELTLAKSAAVYTATGVNQSRQGLITYWLAEMLNFVTGNLGREGGVYKPNGFCSMDPPLPETEIAVNTSLGTFYHGHNYNGLPTTILPDLINNGDIKAMIIITGNPLNSLPGEDRLRQAFEKLDCMVALDIYRTDTVELCDYVLPGTDWLERQDINMFGNGIQLRPYVQYTDAMVKAAAERKDDWWVMANLGVELNPDSPLKEELNENGFVFINQLLAESDLSIAKLAAMPFHTKMIEPDKKASTLDKCLMHKDKKINCCPEIFSTSGLLDRCHAIFEELLAEDKNSLKLVSMRTIHMHNGWLANMPMLRKGILSANPLNISPADAVKYNLYDGDPVKAYNKYGAVETVVLINEELPEGAVALTHGFGHGKAYSLKVASAKPGVNYNKLAPTGLDAFEPLSYMCWLSAIPINIEKIQP
ncbi:MAG: molybdopterin-dependent oxidoreductase [Porticoccaceae bacterium]|nr:molybdopterin-dependent oxidoreductase [Porticoccaceae bacterium]